MALKYIDLFAGIGGFHAAASSLGLNCVLSSEIDAKARSTYLANYKTPLMNEDITTLAARDVPDHDIICAGFPCQPFSQAGFKKGFSDERGNLFFNIFEIAKAKRPRALFLENVRGLLKHDGGNTMAIIKGALEGLGYVVEARVIFAKDFGLPQLRPRLFILATTGKAIVWPSSTPLQITLDEILGGACTRDIGFTLRVGGRGSPIKGRHNWDGYVVDGELVRLNSAQGAALQGFPRGFKFPVSESAAMKQLGNSVAVPAVRAHLLALVESISP